MKLFKNYPKNAMIFVYLFCSGRKNNNNQKVKVYIQIKAYWYPHFKFENSISVQQLVAESAQLFSKYFYQDQFAVIQTHWCNFPSLQKIVPCQVTANDIGLCPPWKKYCHVRDSTFHLLKEGVIEEGSEFEF